MRYERIERSIYETMEFLNKLQWNLSFNERNLLLGNISIEKYLNSYMSHKEKAQQFIDFHFKKVVDFEVGQRCWFWDDKLDDGVLGKFRVVEIGSSTNYITSTGTGWKNCISIEEFRDRLKEYL